MNDFLPLTETLSPADRGEAAEALRAAETRSIPVYPLGGGVHQRYGGRPATPGRGLSLARLNRLIDYPSRDLTITVEAGMTIAELARLLAAERQRLPVDVADPDRATVGGAIAINASGPRRYRWGTMRDYAIGLTALDGCGEAFSGGGRVVKNAAGYDLCRLVCGSLGTLGVVVQATLMVKPAPETSALVAVEVSDLDVADRLLEGMVRTRTVPAAIELLVGSAWADDPALGPLSAGAAGRVVVGLEGTVAEVQWMIGQLQEEWRLPGIRGGVAVVGNQADPLWRRLVDFPHPPSESTAATVEISVLPGSVVAVVRRLLARVPEASIVAHAGNGAVVARLEAPTAELVERLRAEAVTEGGSLAIASQPCGAAWSGNLAWGPPRDGHAVMQAIKSRFDPKNILNRGRFVFPDSTR